MSSGDEYTHTKKLLSRLSSGGKVRKKEIEGLTEWAMNRISSRKLMAVCIEKIFKKATVHKRVPILLLVDSIMRTDMQRRGADDFDADAQAGDHGTPYQKYLEPHAVPFMKTTFEYGSENIRRNLEHLLEAWNHNGVFSAKTRAAIGAKFEHARSMPRKLTRKERGAPEQKSAYSYNSSSSSSSSRSGAAAATYQYNPAASGSKRQKIGHGRSGGGAAAVPLLQAPTPGTLFMLPTGQVVVAPMAAAALGGMNGLPPLPHPAAVNPLLANPLAALAAKNASPPVAADPSVRASRVPVSRFNVKMKSYELAARSDDVIDLMYSSADKQCKTCGRRMSEKAFAAHLDWHFELNNRDKEMREHGQQSQRAWFHDRATWESLGDKEMAKEFADMEKKRKRKLANMAKAADGDQDASAMANGEGGEDGEREKKKRRLIQVDSDHVVHTCLICHDKLSQVFDDEAQQWVYEDAAYHPDPESVGIARDQAIIHRLCRETMPPTPKAQARVPGDGTGNSFDSSEIVKAEQSLSSLLSSLSEGVNASLKQEPVKKEESPQAAGSFDHLLNAPAASSSSSSSSQPITKEEFSKFTPPTSSSSPSPSVPSPHSQQSQPTSLLPMPPPRVKAPTTPAPGGGGSQPLLRPHQPNLKRPAAASASAASHYYGSLFASTPKSKASLAPVVTDHTIGNYKDQYSDRHEPFAAPAGSEDDDDVVFDDRPTKRLKKSTSSGAGAAEVIAISDDEDDSVIALDDDDDEDVIPALSSRKQPPPSSKSKANDEDDASASSSSTTAKSVSSPSSPRKDADAKAGADSESSQASPLSNKLSSDSSAAACSADADAAEPVVPSRVSETLASSSPDSESNAMSDECVTETHDSASVSEATSANQSVVANENDAVPMSDDDDEVSVTPPPISVGEETPREDPGTRKYSPLLDFEESAPAELRQQEGTGTSATDDAMEVGDKSEEAAGAADKGGENNDSSSDDTDSESESDVEVDMGSPDAKGAAYAADDADFSDVDVGFGVGGGPSTPDAASSSREEDDDEDALADFEDY